MKKIFPVAFVFKSGAAGILDFRSNQRYKFKKTKQIQIYKYLQKIKNISHVVFSKTDPSDSSTL